MTILRSLHFLFMPIPAMMGIVRELEALPEGFSLARERRKKELVAAARRYATRDSIRHLIEINSLHRLRENLEHPGGWLAEQIEELALLRRFDTDLVVAAEIEKLADALAQSAPCSSASYHELPRSSVTAAILWILDTLRLSQAAKAKIAECLSKAITTVASTPEAHAHEAYYLAASTDLLTKYASHVSLNAWRALSRLPDSVNRQVTDAYVEGWRDLGGELGGYGVGYSTNKLEVVDLRTLKDLANHVSRRVVSEAG
jgi:hypothetical protein